jgi:hypothetical protein
MEECVVSLNSREVDAKLLENLNYFLQATE